VDYDEPEEPALLSPLEEENYSEGDDYLAHGDGPKDQNENTEEFPAYSAEAVDSVGGKRSQNSFQEGERRRKASRWIGVGSPLQEDNNSQREEDQMD
jgi:hypothetical protein